VIVTVSTVLFVLTSEAEKLHEGVRARNSSAASDLVILQLAQLGDAGLQTASHTASIEC
jgi:hypothetical protein